MIINIPLQIDEEKMEEVVKKDYESKVMGEIVKYIKTALTKHSTSYYGDREMNGMTELIKEKIDIYLEKHNDEIIKAAGNALAEKLARTKRGKAILDGIEEVTA
jgi:uncharacterized membrane protein YheB (UPF0754 family)